MMMEAIRLSLAAEEERKKKEEKEAAKEAKKEEKRKAKEARKAEKASRRGGSLATSSTGNLDGDGEGEPSTVAGKGKDVDRSGGSVGFNPLTEPTSTLNATSREDPQRHLEQSRAQIQRETSGTNNVFPPDQSTELSYHRAALRSLSQASSTSSLVESVPDSLRQGQEGFGASGSSLDVSPNASGVNLDRDETQQNETPGTEPMFNFTSLEAVISSDKRGEEDQSKHIEDAPKNEGAAVEGSSSASRSPPQEENVVLTPPPSEVPDELEESVVTLKPTKDTENDDEETAPSPDSPEVEAVSGSNPSRLDAKHIGDISLADTREQPTQ
jgi:hypothetical protein